MTPPPDGSGDERAADGAGTAPSTKIQNAAAVLAELDAAPKEKRAGAALAPHVLTFAAKLSERSPDWADLIEGLRARGLSINPWKGAVRDLRRSQGARAGNGPKFTPDGRSAILLGPDEGDVNEAAVRALARSQNVYQRHGLLVRIVDSRRRRPGEAMEYTTKEIRAFTVPLLREELSRAVLWHEIRANPQTGEAQTVHVHPPDWCVKAVHDWTFWPGVKPLYHVSEIPLILPDASILMLPGYDARTGIFCEPRVRLPALPSRPTSEDARAAAQRLLALVSDFPFEDDAHRSAWLAALLTPIARWAFAGQNPLFLFDANQSGSGKGLLTKIIGIIVIGGPMDLMSPTDNEEEERKRITSKILRGELMVLVDNIERPFGSATFEALLTSGTWGDRLLGTNEAPKLDASITWYGTGNNVQFVREDMARRTCVCRLMTTEERPEERTNFAIAEPLDGHVLTHRGELLGAALTMLRAWMLTGRKASELPGWGGPWGSCDGWDQVVRGAIVFAGLVDPIGAKGTRNALESSEDGLAELVDGLAEAAAALGKDGEVKTAQIVEALLENDEWRRTDKAIGVRFKLLREAIAKLLPRLPAGRLPSDAVFGKLLARLRGKPHDGRRIMARLLAGRTLWRVEEVPAPAFVDEADERAGIQDEPPRSVAAALPRSSGACAFDDCDCSTCGRCKGCTARTPAEGGCSC